MYPANRGYSQNGDGAHKRYKVPPFLPGTAKDNERPECSENEKWNRCFDEEHDRIEQPLPVIAHLMRLKGIGPEFAAVLYLEGLFRHFENRRQLAAYAGLAPSPWKSGSIDQEQGISKAGNPRLRTTMVELAWMWVRYQPDSALSCWFRQRVGSERGRIRRISIVALARKLLITLSRYVTHGEIPAGAVLKPV